MVRKTAVLFLGCFFIFAVCAPTGVFASGAGISGASFLRIEAGSRASAMGGAFTALSDDGYGMYWNPAGLSRLNKAVFSATHQKQIFDIKNELMSVAVPLGFKSTVGLSGRLLHTTDYYRTEREDGKEFTNYSGSLGLHYAHGERTGFAWGLGAKMIREQLADFKATGYAFDFGVHYQSPRTPLRLGAVIQNIGPDIKFVEEGDPLPRNFRAGWAYDFFPWEKRWTVSNDIIYFQPENIASFAIGSEFHLANFLVLRGGYVTAQDFDAEGNFHTGLGVNYGSLALDYSLLQRSDLDDQHRFSFSYRFGSRAEKDAERAPAYIDDREPGSLERRLRELVPEDGVYHEEQTEYWNDQAAIHSRAGEYEKAIELWLQSLAADPSQRHICRKVGIAYYELGEHEKAQQFMDAASGEELELPATEQPAPEKNEPADPLLEDFDGELDAGEIETLNKRGQKYFEDENYQEAIKYWQHSLQADPEQRDLYRQLGIAFYELGEYEEARHYLDMGSGAGK